CELFARRRISISRSGIAPADSSPRILFWSQGPRLARVKCPAAAQRAQGPKARAGVASVGATPPHTPNNSPKYGILTGPQGHRALAALFPARSRRSYAPKPHTWLDSYWLKSADPHAQT